MFPVFWFVAFPDLAFPVGGVKQIHRACECITELNYLSYIVQDNDNFRPPWFSSTVKTIDKKTWLRLLSEDSTNLNFVIIPETMISLIQYLPAAAKKIIFNQNSSYTFGHPSSPRKFKVNSVLSFTTINLFLKYGVFLTMIDPF